MIWLQNCSVGVKLHITYHSLIQFYTSHCIIFFCHLWNELLSFVINRWWIILHNCWFICWWHGYNSLNTWLVIIIHDRIPGCTTKMPRTNSKGNTCFDSNYIQWFATRKYENCEILNQNMVQIWHRVQLYTIEYLCHKRRGLCPICHNSNTTGATSG